MIEQDWKFFSVQDREILYFRNFSILQLVLCSISVNLTEADRNSLANKIALENLTEICEITEIR